MPKPKKQLVRFKATKTVKKPTQVKFKTKEGKMVSFSAQKSVKVKETVSFRSKKK